MKRKLGLSRKQLDVMQRGNEELMLARKRMGDTPDKRLTWLLDFLRLDLDVKRPEERVALGYDLRMLGMESTPVGRGSGLAGVGRSHFAPAGPMPDDTLRDLQRELAEAIRGLLGPSSRAWQLPPVRASIYRFSFPGAKPVLFGMRYDSEDERGGILWGAISLLQKAGGHLRLCPECQRIFLAVRRQAYCSAACSMRVRNRRRPPQPRKRG